MLLADTVNCIFGLFGGLLLWLNVYRLHHDKEFRGVSIIPVAFFMVWGYWNLYFYPAVGAWLSWIGGMVIVIANTVWLSQMIYYHRKGKL